MCCRVFVVNDSGSALDIVDKQGQVVLTLKSKTFSAHNKWYIFSGNSTNKQDKIATVKPQEDSMNAEVSSDLADPACCISAYLSKHALQKAIAKTRHSLGVVMCMCSNF